MEIRPEDKIFSSASITSFLLLNVILHAYKKAKDRYGQCRKFKIITLFIGKNLTRR